MDDGINNTLPSDLLDKIPAFGEDYKDATRGAGGVVINAISRSRTNVVYRQRRLVRVRRRTTSKTRGDYGRENYAGRNLWFGIREHAMGALLNGAAYDGIFRPSGATFAVFADYLRPSIRLAALANLPVLYIFTHDSVGVGEDGPTHQPIETCSGLRVIPGLDVIRPGDPEEVAGAMVAGLQRTDGPTLLMLTRQKIPTLNQVDLKTRREGVAKGAYVCVKESGPLEVILIGTGSELQHAIDAAKEIGAGAQSCLDALHGTI